MQPIINGVKDTGTMPHHVFRRYIITMITDLISNLHSNTQSRVKAMDPIVTYFLKKFIGENLKAIP